MEGRAAVFSKMAGAADWIAAAVLDGSQGGARQASAGFFSYSDPEWASDARLTRLKLYSTASSTRHGLLQDAW